MQKDYGRLRPQHVVVDGNDVQFVSAESFENGIEFGFAHGNVAGNLRVRVVPGKGGPGVEAHARVDCGSVLFEAKVVASQSEAERTALTSSCVRTSRHPMRMGFIMILNVAPFSLVCRLQLYAEQRMRGTLREVMEGAVAKRKAAAHCKRRSGQRRLPHSQKAGVVNCELSMSKPFDFDIGRLTGEANYSGRPPADFAQTPERGTFFLETFGCQMNDHDSEKVAGVLLARGYRQVETPEAAGLILYNTCSIREKAAQKVFSRLGEYRAKQSQGKIIGVLGCV